MKILKIGNLFKKKKAKKKKKDEKEPKKSTYKDKMMKN